MDRRVMGLAAVGAVGSLVVILYTTLVSHQPVFWFSVAMFGILMVVCESLGDKMVSGGRSTYGIIIIFGAIAALNTPSAMIVALFGSLHLQLIQRGEEPWRLVFNGALYSMYAWAASAVYHVLGGISRSFTQSDVLRSLVPLIVAAGVFWALNSIFTGLALWWQEDVEPTAFINKDALRLLPNQIIYSLVGLGLGIIYAQNAFYLDTAGQIVGNTAGYIRGLFGVLSLLALLGVAWYYSGKNIELLEAYDLSVEVLMTHLERREPYLDGHAVRVASYAALIGRQLRLPFYEVNRLRHAALLHDLGRPAIPREILLQRSPLSEEEFDKIKIHPLEGSSRLEEVGYLADMAEAVRHHHEHYDGGGYIDHLSGDTIPLSARIIAVADAYDSMLHNRPWREAKGHDKALIELRQNSGRQFDPEIVENFIAAMESEVAAVHTAPALEVGVAEAPQARLVEEAPRPHRRKVKHREELLQARREVREKLEREAFEKLGEKPPGAEAGEHPGEGEGRGIVGEEGPPETGGN
jgi:HD-GYP domain-containing protein (c-di-GMP phosphodiesterase class II)